MKNIQVEKLGNIPTPFYYYDIELLQETLAAILRETSESENYHIHYAVKANANPNILKVIKDAGLGVDCVSGGEIQASLDAGFAPDKIVYAGVGKSDWKSF
jgi:diaminopimelate decarboxylase